MTSQSPIGARYRAIVMSLCIGASAGCGGGGAGSGGSKAPAEAALQWSAPAAITYGTALSGTQLDATANVQGTFAYSPASGTVLTAGTHTLTVTFTPTDTQSASQATATTTIAVSKATPVITWVNPAAVTVGTVLGNAQLNASANTAGTFVYSPAAGSTMSAVGNQTLAVTFTPTDSTDYSSAQDNVTLSVVGTGAPSYSWSNVRIVAGGYVTGLYFSPTEKGLMYVRTDVGGAYRRGPNDKQWVPLLDFISRADSNWSGVEALGLDPTDPNRLYLAAGEYNASWAGNCAMLISADQGATFATVPLNFKCGSNEPGRGTGERIAVDPNLPSTVYFGTRENGLQVSTDFGNTWQPMSGLAVTTSNPDGTWSVSDGVVSVLPMKASGSSGSATPVVYAAVAGTGTGGTSLGLYVTVNGGSTASTWTAVSGQPTFLAPATPLAPLEARAGPGGAIYILYGDQAGPDRMNASQLWKFVPGASWTSGTWTQIQLPNQNLTINNSDGYGGLAVDPVNPGVLLVSTLDQYWPTGDVVYRSTDDGATWRDVSSVTIDSSSKSPNLATHDYSQAPYVGGYGPVSTGNWVTALAIDPFDPAHAMYSTGGGVWITADLTNADPSASSTGVVAWDFDDVGIEETAVEGLWAPPSGKTLLLSSIGDVHGFAHQDLTVSPPQGGYANPAVTPTSMDFEQNTPTTVVRVVDGSSGATPVGSVSTDAGLTWTAFGSAPSGSNGGGTIAIAPDGSALVWAPKDTTSVWYSKDAGKTWTASAGIGAQAQVVSDRVKSGVFYGFSGGTLSMSTDGGASFSAVQTGLPGSAILKILPDAQADLWITGGWSGSMLYTNTGSAASPRMTAVSSVQTAYQLGFGMAAPGSKYLTLFLDGQVGGQWGIYRSTDGGADWIQINDASHQWGGTSVICGDMRTFGSVYMGTAGGRGIVWGTSPQ